ncbi:MAG: hypothetical protein ACE5NC_04360 [Anaerolineae bacterium]
MHRLRLIHWKEGDAEERAERLRALGYEVDHDLIGSDTLKSLRQDPPDAMVIDLSRLPMQGRDVGIAVRHSKATRNVPIVFVGGKPEKVSRVQEILPDAVYTEWGAMDGALEAAINHPPREPVVPESVFAGYSGTPLPKKLGIKEGFVVALIGAPDDFEETLGALPEGAVVRRQRQGKPDVALWFGQSRRDVESRMERMSRFIGEGRLWILWPKKASAVKSDLTQAVVREVGLAAGLVDYKIAAIDQTWSGLLFTQRKAE